MAVDHAGAKMEPRCVNDLCVGPLIGGHVADRDNAVAVDRHIGRINLLGYDIDQGSSTHGQSGFQFGAAGADVIPNVVHRCPLISDHYSRARPSGGGRQSTTHPPGYGPPLSDPWGSLPGAAPRRLDGPPRSPLAGTGSIRRLAGPNRSRGP